MWKVTILALLATFTLKVEGQAIGDIRLEKVQNSPYYEVLIYYTDGLNPPDWGGICGEVPVTTVNVLCRQLGFQPFGENPTDTRDTGRPVWLEDVVCSSDNTHILQCNYREIIGSNRNSANSCGGRRLRQLIRCDFQKRLEPYNGEIRLCPPDNSLNNPNNVNITSVSFGVVALYISFGNRGYWRGVVQLSGGSGGLLSSNEANAICRQLGFTDAVVGSAVARSATNRSELFNNNCYSASSPGSQGYVIQPHAWMATEAVKCDNSQNCLGCCYSTPPETGCLNCEEQQDIIIGCTFDITKSKQATGTREKCNLNNKQCLAAECSNEKKLISGLRGGLGFFSAFLILIIIIILLIIISVYIYKHHQKNYDNIS